MARPVCVASIAPKMRGVNLFAATLRSANALLVSGNCSRLGRGDTGIGVGVQAARKAREGATNKKKRLTLRAGEIRRELLDELDNYTARQLAFHFKESHRQSVAFFRSRYRGAQIFDRAQLPHEFVCKRDRHSSSIPICIVFLAEKKTARTVSPAIFKCFQRNDDATIVILNRDGIFRWGVMRPEFKQPEHLNRFFSASRASGILGAWEWDAATDLVRTDSGVAQLFSVNSEEAARGAPLQDFLKSVHPGDLAQLQRSIERGLDEGLFESRYRVVVGGRLTEVFARGGACRDPAGQILGLCGIVMEIGTNQHSERQLDFVLGLVRRVRQIGTDLHFGPIFTALVDTLIAHLDRDVREDTRMTDNRKMPH